MTVTLQIKKNRPNYYILVRYKDNIIQKGKQKWITTDILVKGNNKRKAEKKLIEIISESEKEQVDLGKNILFTDFLEIWLKNMKTKIQPITYDAYRLVVIRYFEPYKLKIT